jgi:uncharacterized protein YdaU (DUF1376 family)
MSGQNGTSLRAEWFWTDRWIGSSAFLLPIEARGLYREMLTQAWRRGAQLPNDHEAIRRAVGATEDEWARNWSVIKTYWKLRRIRGRNVLINETQLQIYKDARARLQRATDKGLQAARVRWSRA